MQHYSPHSLSTLSRRDLQKLCKRDDIVEWSRSNVGTVLKANAKTAELVQMLGEYFGGRSGAAGMKEMAEVVETIQQDTIIQQQTLAAAVIPSPHVLSAIHSSPEHDEQQEQDHHNIDMIDIPASILVPSSDDEHNTSIPSHPAIPLASDFPALIEEHGELANEMNDIDQAPLMNIIVTEADASEVDKVEKEADEDAELHQLESEIIQIESKLQAVKQQDAIIEEAEDEEKTISKSNKKRKTRKSVAPASSAAANKKVVIVAATEDSSKPTAVKKSVVLTASNKKKQSKSIAPTATSIPSSSSSSASSSSIFSRKTIVPSSSKISKIAKPSGVAAVKKMLDIAPIQQLPVSPPANSLASAFSLPSSFITTSSSAVASSTSATPSNSAAGGMDAYWSLMAELDKRVEEKKKSETVNGSTDDATPTAASSSSALTATQSKLRTASKFDAIHARQASKAESIVDYQQRLDAKKRANAALATPLALTGTEKKRKLAHNQESDVSSTTMGVEIPTIISAVPFTMLAASPVQFVASLSKPKRTNGKSIATSSTLRKTRSSFKVEKKITTVIEEEPAVTPAPRPLFSAKPSTTSRRTVAPASGASAASVSSSRRTIIPGSAVSACSVATATSHTSTTSHPHHHNNSSHHHDNEITSSSKPSSTVKKFDLSASLAKPLSWKPYKGKIESITASKSTKKLASSSSTTHMTDKENAPHHNIMNLQPITIDLSVPKATVTSSSSHKSTRKSVKSVNKLATTTMTAPRTKPLATRQ